MRRYVVDQVDASRSPCQAIGRFIDFSDVDAVFPGVMNLGKVYMGDNPLDPIEPDEAKSTPDAVLVDFLGVEPVEILSLSRFAMRRMTVTLPIPGTPVSNRMRSTTTQLFFNFLA